MRRRLSVSADHANSAQNSSKAHRSNDSHHLHTGNGGPIHPPSIAYSGASTTPQQKMVVQALINNRIKNKLPINSGLSLDVVESDPATQRAVCALVEIAHESLDIISWSLSELLERLAKQIDADGQMTTEALQSQLFILKILSVCMTSRWNHRHEQDETRPSRAGKPQNGSNTPSHVESPVPSSSQPSRRFRQPSTEFSSSTPPPWTESYPLDDNCARYILSVMVLYLRQTAAPEARLMSSSNLAPDASLHDFESVDLPTESSAFDDYTGKNGPLLPPHISHGPKPILKLKNSAASFQSAGSANSAHWQLGRTFQFEKTHMALVKSALALNLLISKFAGRIVYHLSASNWLVVFHRIRQKIHFLASTAEDNPDTIDLQLMTHSAMDRARLVQVLHELSSLLVNMKRQAQAAVAIPLRMAIWNWIEMCPQEYNEAVRSRGRLEGAPERVFDLLHSANEPGRERALWPTLTVLACLAAERLSPDYQVDVESRSANIHSYKSSHRKDIRFVEDLLRHANTTSKLADVSFVCAIDMCRAGFRISPEGEMPLRHIAADISHEVKLTLQKSPGQKPSWDSCEEIDVATYAEALVAVFRFLSEEESISLFMDCLEPERSDAVKICAIKAATTLAIEAPRLPWQQSLEKLQNDIAPRLRDIYKAASVRLSEYDSDGTIRRAASRPKAKRFTSETLIDKDLMLLSILALWRASPDYYITNIGQSHMEGWLSVSARIRDSDVDTAVKISAATSNQHLIDIYFKMPPNDPYYETIEGWMKHSLPMWLIAIAKRLLLTRLDPDTQRLWMHIAHQIIECYHRKSEGNHAHGVQFSEERVPAFAMSEIAFLVSLTSVNSDVSQLAAQGLRLIAQAERQSEAPVNHGLTEEERSKRNPIYEQLGDPSVIIVGRVQEQKRVRKLLRLVANSSPINIAVWEECFYRWSALSEFVVQHPLAAAAAFDDAHLSKQEQLMSLEDKFIQWKNLTLFLAAFGGVTVQETHDPGALAAAIPPDFLLDDMRTLRDPADLVTIFIEFLTGALIDDVVRVREVAREALGSELSPRLFSKLFKHLDEITRNITDGAGSEFKDEYGLFLDQLISVLKSLVENAQMPPDEALSVDLGSILYVLVGFISRFSDPVSYRIRVKFCALCESICHRTDTLTLRKDDLSRNRIVDVVMDWFQDPLANTDPEAVQFQYELNTASLRTVVKLLERLKLQPIDNNSNDGDDFGHVVSRLFIRYSHVLLRALDICRSDPIVSSRLQISSGTILIRLKSSDSTSDVPSLQKKMQASQKEADIRDMVITGLSHLVISNSENAVKHCIASAYDSDMRKRTIFVHVFARVLGQGTKFEAQGNPELQARRDQLRELVKGSDMVLAMVICECCPANEVDMMISVLMNIFDTRASLVALLKTMIDREIAHTTCEVDLFRGNSTCTRFLSAFARIHGYNYLRGLIVPLIKTMTSMPPGHAYDLDPTKASRDKLEQNQKNVKLVALSFLDIISSSVPALPPMIREVCAHLAKSVYQVWPDSKFAALGAFIFLRFISPAIVAPEIVDVAVPRDDGGVIRRGLMVIAKIMQNLANNIFFAKEAHMVCLNEFLGVNITSITRYLSEVNKFSSTAVDEESTEWLGTTADDTDTIVLHRFLDKHADKIGKELLSYAKLNACGEEDASTANAKRAWDHLCNLLVELSEVPEVPRFSQLPRSEHREFIDLMNRCAHRSIESVQDIFVAADVPLDLPAVFVLRVCQIDVEALDIELLMYHSLKTLLSPAYENRKFEVVLDCTSFTSTSEIPAQWLTTCSQLIPIDIRSRFQTSYVLNPNSLTQKYLRRMYNISSGTMLASGVRACSSVAELLQYVPQESLTVLRYPTSLEEESSTVYTEVTMRQAHEMRIPVTMEVAETHVRVTSIRAAVISPNLSCKSTEIISLADVSDAYNVSTGLDPYEFIIRRSKQGVTSYFSSPQRDGIVKSIRAAKSQLRDTRYFSMDRFPRFSNISATLLHVGMLNIDSEDEGLRGAAYDLLGALCSYLNYDKSPIIASKAGIIPGDISTFAIGLSDRLAGFVPKLTLDFISVISAGMDKANAAQRITCLQYMSPWVKNLAQFCIPTNSLYEHSGARLRDCIRSLIDLTISDLEISSMVHKYIWVEIGRQESTLVFIVLEELIRAASDGGIGSRRCETVARTTAALSSINVRGRIFSKLRKVLGKTSLKPSKTLPENVHWNEIATLTRFALVASNHSKQAAYDQLYIPDIFHIVTLIAGTGQTIVRKSLYGVIMNFLQSMYLARAEDPSAPDLRNLIDELVKVENLMLFGLTRQSSTSEYFNYDPPNDNAVIDSQEALTRLLVRVMEVTSGSRGLLNIWRARWMSLATSTAFQLPAAIQCRAFLVLGTLAASDVDDDLVYQMLVAFKTALGQSTGSDTMTVVCMLRCICKVVPSLTEGSRYLCQIFWLAVALLQSSYIAFYSDAAELMRATVETLEKHGAFEGSSIPNVLLDGRVSLEDTVCQLDHLLCLSFDSSFSFTLAAIIFKGVRRNHLKSSAELVLRSLLSVTARCDNQTADGPPSGLCPDALGYFIALIPFSTTHKSYVQLLQDCKGEEFLPAPNSSHQNDFVPRVSVDLLSLTDSTSALLTVSFVSTMLTTAQGDDAETEILYNLLADIGAMHPESVSMIYDTLQDRIKDAFANSSNAAIIRAVTGIFRNAQDSLRLGSIHSMSASTLNTVDESSPAQSLKQKLEELAMDGLTTNFHFLVPNQSHWGKIAAWISDLVLKIVGLE
ncbi:uncharacterized protein EDB91DRAFT_1102988 [Suillus paluster]|uniref:uncharacterized protein n=1 Tax=Suillus paluster TaxID=48578 RepID=UPI001B861211|nr:uncharacterized protein EDB91DRAFT_1102988 [Suillus paluster]KAG1752509.1 hypothetical protein EDB91DRAFT_1102988 [Suillus paluster]